MSRQVWSKWSPRHTVITLSIGIFILIGVYIANAGMLGAIMAQDADKKARYATSAVIALESRVIALEKKVSQLEVALASK